MAGPKTLTKALNDKNLEFKPWLFNFNPEIFEVDFSDVIKGRGPSIYLDPDEFFANTFMTQRMTEVLQWCLTRTAGLNNKGIIYLATGFGGGKSHLLTMLYHIFTSKKGFDPHILDELSLIQVPDVRVIAIDGHNLIHPMTECFELKDCLKTTKEQTVRALESEGKPVVILVDELVVYLAKLSDQQQHQEIAHIHSLIEAVKSTRNCVLVITNPKGYAVYGKESEQLDTVIETNRKEELSGGISGLLSRVTQPIIPIEKEDFVSILKKRLVEHIDSKISNEVEVYLSRRLNIDFTNYYPFHPHLIDVLYNRVSLYPGFQKTRDALKVVALAIKGLLLNRDQANFYIIAPSDLVFDDPDLKAILTNEKVFGSNLEQAVTQDVVKAAKSADSGVVFGRFGRIVSSVYLYSLHPEQVKRGASVRDIYQCLTDAMSEEDVKQLLDRFYSDYSTFLWLEGGRYLFKSRQNIPNMIKIKANQVSGTEVSQFIEGFLYKTVFEDATNDECTFYRANIFMPSPNRINTVVCLYWEKIEDIVTIVLSINAQRKNSVIVLIPEYEQKGPVEWYSKLVLGAERVLKEVRGEKDLSQEAKKLKEQNEAQAIAQFRSRYSEIKFLRGTAIRSTQLDPLKGSTIRDSLIKRLKESGKVLDIDNASPKQYLVTLLSSRKEEQVRILYNDVETMTSIPYISRKDLRTLIQKGVYEGAVGLIAGMIPENEILSSRSAFHFREQNITVNDGDTIVTPVYFEELKTKFDKSKEEKSGKTTNVPPEEPPVVSVEKGKSVILTEEKETFVSDASDLYKNLNDKLTNLLLKDEEARASVVFSGMITGSVSANNLQEIRSIVDLADGLQKASSLLGGVKVTATIYKKVRGSNGNHN